MSEYLQYFPTPFLEDLIKDRCLPFVGAGLSLNAILPEGENVPDWNGMGKSIASKLSDYEYTTPVEALSTYEQLYQRSKLVEALHDILHISHLQPGRAHEEFCRIPFDLVVTTNWDMLLEAGYARADLYCMPILSEDQLGLSQPDAGVRLLKIHGDLHHPERLVATEEDYDGFLSRSPLIATYLSSLLIDHTPLFIGYSLDDPDFRQIWQVIKDRLGKLRRPAYSLQVAASAHAIGHFQRRGVTVINLPTLQNRSYGETLAIAFMELATYWRANLPMTSTSTDAEQVELSLPSSAQSRLAFYAVPTKDAAIYKEYLYPLAERYGFTPIMAVDVLSPGDNVMAKVEALIGRSAIVIADIGTQNTTNEAMIALSRPSPEDHLIVIARSAGDVPTELRQRVPVLIHTEKFTPEFMASLAGAVGKAFERMSSRLSQSLSDEPQRLIEKGEFRASVLASFSLLEHELQLSTKELNAPTYSSSRLNLRQLIDMAALNDLISADLAWELHQHASVRNEIAHSPNRVVNESEAKLICEHVTAAVDALREYRQNQDK